MQSSDLRHSKGSTLLLKTSPTDNTTTLGTLQKQAKCKIKGRETGIYKKMANVEMLRAVGGHVVQFNNQETDRWPGERLKERKQWCNYGRIFFVSRFVPVVALRARISCFAL